MNHSEPLFGFFFVLDIDSHDYMFSFLNVIHTFKLNK